MLPKALLARLNRPSGRVISYLLVGAALFWLYFWRIGSMTRGFGPEEVSLRLSSHSWRSIFDNPVLAPFKVLERLVIQLGHSPWFLRSLSATIAIFIIICFWRIAVDWFGNMIGLLGTILFATTPWLVTEGRLADGNIMLLSPMFLLVLFLWLRRTKRTFWVGIAFWIALALAIYIPGLIWVELVTAVIARRRLITIARQLKISAAAIGPILFLLILVPLVLSLVQDWHSLKTLLLIPDNFSSVVRSLKDVAWSGLALVWQSPYHLGFTIGRWPLLSIAQVILAAIGSLIMWSRARRIFYGLALICLMAVIAAGLNKNLAYLLLALPALAILHTAGLRYLYLEWRVIFPRNPLAQSFAIVLLIMLVTCQFIFSSYLATAAWPHSVATQTSYVLK